MALTQYIQVGVDTMSNISMQSDLSADVFALNLIFTVFNAYCQRGGLKFIEDLKFVDADGLTQFSSNSKLYCIVEGNKLFSISDNGVVLTAPQDILPHSIINFNNQLYFISGTTVYVYSGSGVPQIATYEPRKFIQITNSVDIVTGSPIATFRVDDHGLIPGQKIDLESFGFGLNGTDLAVTTVPNAGSFTATYSTNFTQTLQNIGGAGLLIAYYPAVNFPAATLITSYRNRMYLAGDPVNPYTLYISNLVSTFTGTSVRFAENTDDILNLGFASEVTASQTIPIDQGFNGNIVNIIPTEYGVYVALETQVKFFNGFDPRTLMTALYDDTTCNPRAYCSRGGVTYIMGFNNMYMSRTGQSIFQPIATQHEYYVKNKDPLRVRMVYFNNLVIATLGSLRDFDSKVILPRLQTIEGQVPADTELSNFAIVLDVRQKGLSDGGKFTFFNNFNISDFEIVRSNDNLTLQAIQGQYLVEYDTATYKDIDTNFERLFITHPRALGDINKMKVFQKIHLYHERCVNIECWYKLISYNTDNVWKKAKSAPESGTHHSVYVLPDGSKARMIQLYFGVINEAETTVIDGYQIEFTI